jgi:hypothetical protein
MRFYVNKNERDSRTDKMAAKNIKWFQSWKNTSEGTVSNVSGYTPVINVESCFKEF